MGVLLSEGADLGRSSGLGKELGIRGGARDQGRSSGSGKEHQPVPRSEKRSGITGWGVRAIPRDAELGVGVRRLRSPQQPSPQPAKLGPDQSFHHDPHQRSLPLRVSGCRSRESFRDFSSAPVSIDIPPDDSSISSGRRPIPPWGAVWLFEPRPASPEVGARNSNNRPPRTPGRPPGSRSIEPTSSLSAPF